jgi:hypothetical protein
MYSEGFRMPTPLEELLMQRLLQADFPGKETVAHQLAKCEVRTIDSYGDSYGSLELCPQIGNPAAVIQRIPVEAEGLDEDGVPISVLLHVVNGVVSELEIYKADGSPIRKMPHPQDLQLVVLPPPPWARIH